MLKTDITNHLKYWEIDSTGVVFNHNNTVEFALEVQLPPAASTSSAIIQALTLQNRINIDQTLSEGARLRYIHKSIRADASLIESFRNARQQIVPHAHEVSEVQQLLRDVDAAHLEDLRRTGGIVQTADYFCVALPTPKRAARTTFTEEQIDSINKRVDQQRDSYLGALSGMNLDPRPLGQQDAFQLMWEYFQPDIHGSLAPKYRSPGGFGDTTYQELNQDRSKRTWTLREQVAGSSIDLTRLEHLVVGNKLVTVISVSTPAGRVSAGLMEELLERLAGCTYYLMVDIKHLEQTAARKNIEGKVRTFSNAMVDGAFGGADVSNESKLVGLKGAELRRTNTGEHYVRMGISVVLFADTLQDMKQLKEAVGSTLRNITQATCQLGNVSTVTQYCTALPPLMGGMNDFNWMALSQDAADMVPMTGSWKGSKRPALCYVNRRGGLTTVDPYNPAQNNFNMGIIGGSGSGKTFNALDYVLNVRSAFDATTMIIDPGKSYVPLVRAIASDSAIIPIALNEGIVLNLFDLPEGQHKPDDLKQEFIMSALRELIPAETGSEKNTEDALLQAAIEVVYEINTTRVYNPATDAYDDEFRGCTVGDYVETLGNLTRVGDRNLTSEMVAIAARLATQLENYVGDTPYGRFLDGPTNIDLEGDVICLDTSNLGKGTKISNITMLILMDQILRRIKNLPRSVFKQFVLEEAWSLPQQIIEPIFRMIRTYNGSGIVISQKIEDLLQMPGVLANVSNFLIGRSAGEEHIIQQVLGLSDDTTNKIRSLGGLRGKYREFLLYSRFEDGNIAEVIQNRPNAMKYGLFSSHATDIGIREQVLQECHGDMLRSVLKLANAF